MIIPTRDRWARLRRTLETAFAQQEVTVEVIVVDEGSTDGTAEGLRGLAHPELRVIHNERPLGQAAARNRGIEAARGEWLAFLDDDDLWAPRKLRRQIDAARAAAAGFAYASAVVVDDGFHALELYEAPPADELRRLLVSGNALPAGASNVVTRADLVAGVGGFDERLNQLADWDLWIRLAGSARGAACAEVLVAYLYHSGNFVLRAAPEVWGEFERVVAKHEDAARECGVRFTRADLTYWIAQRQAESGLRLRALRTFLLGAVLTRSPHHVRPALRTLLLGKPRAEAAEDIPVPAWLDAYHDGL